jgi:hypothetical protein
MMRVNMRGARLLVFVPAIFLLPTAGIAEVSQSERRPISTSGAAVPAPAPTASVPADIPRTTGTRMESISRPAGPNGVWLEFEGARYYSDGKAAVFAAERFTKIGDYRGFPVYKANNGRANEIWVAVVLDGPVAPYSKR